MKTALNVLQQEAASLFETRRCIDVDILGRLIRELSWTMGETRAQGVMARMGLSLGQKESYENTEPHCCRGLFSSLDKSPDSNHDEQIFETTDSLEAISFREFFITPSKTPQCWFLSGYLSGWISVKSELAMIAMETTCRAKGDSCCRFVVRPLSAWEKEEKEELGQFREDNLSEELATLREQLKITRDRYQTLFEQSSVPILIIDPTSGAFQEANIACEMLTGYPRQQLMNMTLFDLCRPADHHQLALDLRNLGDGENDVETEITLVQQGGNERKVSVSAKILSFGGQTVIQYVLRDLTDLKLSEQKERDLQKQLQRSERLSTIGRLAASVAHEIKNPLGSIRNAVYYVRKALDQSELLESDPHLKQVLELSEQEVDSAVTIIEELLDFSRVIYLTPRKASINDLLETLPKSITVPERINVTWDLDVTLPSAMVDPNRLKQVFVNIMANAIQSMPNGGTLTISSRLDVTSSSDQNDDLKTIAVGFEDTGVGIEASHLAKIFEPLYTTKAQGTGLGLAISRNIIEKHEGRIEVTSKVGKGTRFIVHIPIDTKFGKEALSHDL